VSEQLTEAGADATAGEKAAADVAEGMTESPSESHSASAEPDQAEPKAPANEAHAHAGSSSSDPTTTFGKLMVMAPGEHHAEAGAGIKEGLGLTGAPRFSAMAAVVALAAVIGAIGGSLATIGMQHATADDAASSANRSFEAAVARIDTEIGSLRTNIDHIAKANAVQFGKTGERLDRMEKAQAEPTAKLAKLSEAVDKLRAAPAVAAPPAAPSAAPPVPMASAAPAVPAVSKDVTGSIPAPAAAAPRPEIGRLPTVEGWVLRDVADGGALIEGRPGVYEVYAGDPVPGLGRVEAIRRQDGRWVVVTSKGLIVAR